MTVITLEDTIIESIVKMAEGNPGAITVMMSLVKEVDYGLISIMKLDDMNLRGWKIWVGFKDFCKSDINKFYDCIMDEDKEMQKYINDYS